MEIDVAASLYARDAACGGPEAPASREEGAQESTQPTTDDPVTFLPPGLAEKVLLLLPAPHRLRCREVSRAWRAALAPPRLWRVLDLSAAATGVGPLQPRDPRSDAFRVLLLAASAAAAGELKSLDVTGAGQVAAGALHSLILRGDARCLSTLRAAGTVPWSLSESPRRQNTVLGILRAAPRLTVFEADVSCESAEQVSLALGTELRTTDTYAALRIRRLGVSVARRAGGAAAEAEARELAVATLLRDAAAAAASPAGGGVQQQQPRPFPRQITWSWPHTTAPLSDALASALILGRVGTLDLDTAQLHPAFLPHLSRALRAGWLRELRLRGYCWSEGTVPVNLLAGASEEAIEDLCAALRASRLEVLELDRIAAWEAPAPLCRVLGALSGHGTLRELRIPGNRNGVWRAAGAEGGGGDGEEDEADAPEAQEAAAGEALAGLVRADSPALRRLHVGGNALGAAAVGRLFDAVAQSNRHLEVLSCRQWAALEEHPPVSSAEAFARERVLPAVRACASLLTLNWNHPAGGEPDDGGGGAAVAEIEAMILRERRRGAERRRSGSGGGGGGVGTVSAVATG